MHELLGGEPAGQLLSQLGRLLTGYEQMHGHTCGIGDLVLTDQAEQARKAIVEETEQVGIEAMESFLKERGYKDWDAAGISRQNAREEGATPPIRHWGRTARAKR